MKRHLAPLLVLALVLSSIALVPVYAAPQAEAALSYVEANRDAIVRDWIELVQIPGKSTKEQKRVEWIREKFEEVGLLDVKVDEMGNVTGFIAGAPEGPTVLFAAHMDTVFENDTDLTPTIKDGRLHCPGSGDDTPSVVGLIWLAKALKETGTRTNANLILAATVQEEIGLKGMAYLMDHIDRKVDMVVAVDGGLGGVTAGALGIKWVKAIFTTPSGHTLSSMGKPSAAKTLGVALGKVYEFQVEQDPRIHLNCGVLGGGTVPNAICGEAWMTIDMRSQDGAALSKLSDNVFAALRAAAAETGATFTYEMMNDIPAGVLPGAAEHKLTTTAVEVLRELGFNPTVGFAGATDANVGIAKGIHSINIGMTKSSGGHSFEESSEIESIHTGMKQLIMLATRL
ncbi:MAG: M20/M25/M40 family metallo-hydrolase [Firmicutes bacterium]|nr:M20/M25/M40 family metallo-hydrolase [Bacillota bacterium]